MKKSFWIFLLSGMFVLSCAGGEGGGGGGDQNGGDGNGGQNGGEQVDLPTAVIETEKLKIYPAPKDEPLNTAYVVRVDGQAIPVYNARVGVGNKQQREEAFGNPVISGNTFSNAGMAYFDLKNGTATISVTVDKKITKAVILPSSAGITGTVNDKTLTFDVSRPMNLTIDIDNETIKSLHLFVNPEETNVPDRLDPNVIYFGPGVHKVSRITVGSGQTVYVAGGAIIKGNIGADDPGWPNPNTGIMNYNPTFELTGDNITFRGRGIIDQTLCHTHARNMLMIKNATNVKLEGVILHNSSVWTVPVRESQNVEIDNIKLFGYRSNADGIDICSSFDVTVHDCFIRTSDDLIVVKTPKESGPAARIKATKCVLWNGIAHALSVGAEMTKAMEDVEFSDCDIIHDHCREWSLRVYQTDKAVVKNIRFENIRIEESQRFASLWIGEAVWTTDDERGHIEDIVFRNITANNIYNSKYVELVGYDEDHAIDNVLFENVMVNGRAMREQDIFKKEFATNITVTP